jgi:hypothetical protein
MSMIRDDAVNLMQGVEFLTHDGAIQLMPAGLERLQRAHEEGRAVVIEVNGQLKFWLNARRP